MLEEIAAGALVESGKYTIRPSVNLSALPASMERPPMVTQARLEFIAVLDELGKTNVAKARAERKKVLRAMDAGAPVEPGKYKAHIRTRWRRKIA